MSDSSRVVVVAWVAVVACATPPLSPPSNHKTAGSGALYVEVPGPGDRTFPLLRFYGVVADVEREMTIRAFCPTDGVRIDGVRWGAALDAAGCVVQQGMFTENGPIAIRFRCQNAIGDVLASSETVLGAARGCRDYRVRVMIPRPGRLLRWKSPYSVRTSPDWCIEMFPKAPEFPYEEGMYCL